MNIIELKALSNGAHRNQTVSANSSVLPEGWAVIPEGLTIPNTFPFVEVEAENGVVKKLTAASVPEPEPECEEAFSAQDDTDFMLVDHEYRLTLLELGLSESEVTE